MLGTIRRLCCLALLGGLLGWRVAADPAHVLGAEVYGSGLCLHAPVLLGRGHRSHRGQVLSSSGSRCVRYGSPVSSSRRRCLRLRGFTEGSLLYWARTTTPSSGCFAARP